MISVAGVPDAIALDIREILIYLVFTSYPPSATPPARGLGRGYFLSGAIEHSRRFRR
jgi:hypothetical protein